MWIKCNINPLGKDVGDCVVRAVGIATDRTWHSVYDDLCDTGHRECDMPNSDPVWGKYLFQQGFDPFILQQRCPKCLTVEQFCKVYPRGVYIIGTGSHSVCVIDGDYWDSWDSGQTVASFFWRLDH